MDTQHQPLKFTNPKTNCVLFDILGNGSPLCVSWPEEGSGGAWLVLPDSMGRVTSVAQMFGDHTPHADADYLGVKNHPNPTGFLALQYYDQLAQGGNQDGVIDSNDKIWSQLRLWIDGHCARNPSGTVCTANPEELHTLDSMGITSISLTYNPSTKKDKFGNLFKFYSNLNPDSTMDARGQKHWAHQKSYDDRLAYDVYLALGQ